MAKPIAIESGLAFALSGGVWPSRLGPDARFRSRHSWGTNSILGACFMVISSWQVRQIVPLAYDDEGGRPGPSMMSRSLLSRRPRHSAGAVRGESLRDRLRAERGGTSSASHTSTSTRLQLRFLERPRLDWGNISRCWVGCCRRRPGPRHSASALRRTDCRTQYGWVGRARGEHTPWEADHERSAAKRANLHRDAAAEQLDVPTAKV